MFISFRTPSTAESIESPFGFPESRSGTNPVTASSGNPTESENIANTPEIPTAVPEVGSVGSSEQIAVATCCRGALSSSPVPVTKNSGTPLGDSTNVNVAEKLPASVPEAGSAGSSKQIEVATGSCVVLCSPVPETKNQEVPLETQPMLTSLKNYLRVFLKKAVCDPSRKRKIASRLLEHCPTL